MIEYMGFRNFRVLKDAELRLGAFNLLVGPNGSGKSTVFKALEVGRAPQGFARETLCTAGFENEAVELRVGWKLEDNYPSVDNWGSRGYYRTNLAGTLLNSNQLKNYANVVQKLFNTAQIFALDPSKIAETVQLQPNVVLRKDGANLAAALDNLRDESRECFEQLELELRQWLPEFDSITFQTPAPGQRSFGLRQRASKRTIPSSSLSEGTLIAVTLLYISNNPKSASIICLEEPDRGLHPRLLRDLRDAIYRLSYPKEFGSERNSIQIIATTHSPYFLDLFREHPEEIIIAEKQEDASSKFKRLADDKELLSILSDAPLGEVWYSGVLGGIPRRKQ